MIEHIRKYSGLMIVVLVVVFISFFFMDTNSMRGASGSPTVIRIAGTGYTNKDFQRMGVGSYQLLSLDYGFLRAFGPFVMRNMGSDDAPKQFFVGRILLRQAKDEFGIHPSEEEISSYIRKMSRFAGPDGNFDSEGYAEFVHKVLGRFGMTEHDLRELASDAIVSTKLQSILGSGLGVDRGVTALTMALDNQEAKVELGRIDLSSYEDKIDPKEEEIKTHWESIQDQFKTEVLRKFTYIIVGPEAVAEPAPEAPAPLPADANDEAKAAAKKAEEDKKAAAAAKLAEARRAAQIKVDGMVDDFLVDLEDQKGAGFEDLAKKNGWEVKTTELFPQSKAPAELDANLRSSSTGGKASQVLFQIRSGGDAFSKISPAIAIGEGQWLVARLDAEEPSRKKTYAEARADARADFISVKAVEALKTAADEAAAKIKEGLAANKSFADAAKEAGVADIKISEKVSRTYRPDAVTEPQGLFEAIRNVDPGTIATPIVESDRAFIAYVVKREVVKEANADARLDAEVKNRAAQNENTAFDAWLTERIEAAKVEDLYAQR